MIFGLRPIIEAIEAGKQLEKVYLKKGADGVLLNELAELCRSKRIHVQWVPIEKLNYLTRNGNHQGAVALTAAIEYVDVYDMLAGIPEDETPLVVVFDGVTDVRNFGAIARSAECAGAHGLITPLKNSAPVNAEAIRSSAGVRVHDTLGHKVIHQRTEVARMARQNELFFAQCIAGGVQAGQQPLRSRFLVAGGAIELPRTVQTANVLALQRCFQTGGVHTVVFDGIGRAQDLDMLKALDAAVEGILHVLRQTAGSTLQVHFLGVLTAGLHKDGVAVLARKAHHLVLDGGAVARADAAFTPRTAMRI